MVNPVEMEKRIHLAAASYLQNHPNGCTMSELVRGIKYSRKAIEKHLQVLILENEIYMKQFGMTKVYYPNRKVQHLEFERLDYNNRTIWFDVLENEFGQYLLIQKKKKAGNEWVHEHSITIPIEIGEQFLLAMEKIVHSPKIKKMVKRDDKTH